MILTGVVAIMSFSGCSTITPEQVAQAEKDAQAAANLARAAYCMAPPSNGSDTALRAWTVVCAAAATKTAP